MPDRFSSNASSLSAPATNAFAITPNDAADLPEVTRAVYVGTGGNVAVRLISGQSVVFTGVSGSVILPIRADRVLSTGTTASNLIGLL